MSPLPSQSSNPRKVLYSPEFGAGWSTWNDDKYADDFLFDAALVAAVESGEAVGEAVQDFEQRMKAKHGVEYLCVLGADDLSVAEVDGPFRVHEYDGSESIVQASEERWH